MILDCDKLWTRLVTAVYKVRRLPRVTNDPPPLGEQRKPHTTSTNPTSAQA